MTLPCASVATQNDDDGHETEAPSLPPYTAVEFVHELPLYVSASPLSPTAAQNEADGQDTEVSALPSMFEAALHELPLYVSAFPLQSTATQNEDVGQDTPPIPS